ncbi:hypothetical protein SERLADRAFT_437725 [Serpula lacrymans var. lacrymans S7.9]|nr:uncharacterized protein SERLADRAFT_437725 [Serpula lacrymans var. lacrymans S7.9]EGO25996.1 hypothetical protein SERLADRAFT_437725 [Serpula lacrymans var. lacrymans S7.9]
MSPMTESGRQSSQAATIPQDVVAALTTLHDYVSSSLALPPQVIATCRGEKRAFGRNALQTMSYRKAVELFINRFATKDDWWISEFRYKPEVSIYAMFYRTHGEEDEGLVLLDERGWPELVGNAVKLNIIFTSLKFTVTT